jgi:hypothetical protein
MEVRWLAQLFVLNSDETLGTAAQKAIQAFPDVLPFEYEEEKQDREHVASLARTAEIWSHIGDIETYSASRAPGGSGIIIQHNNLTGRSCSRRRMDRITRLTTPRVPWPAWQRLPRCMPDPLRRHRLTQSS